MKRLCRRSALHVAASKARLADWQSDLRLVRGRCHKKRCGNRWGVVRVSLDFRDPDRVDRLATLECASCGRTWRRVRVPPLRSAGGYQAVRLTLILRGSRVKRWRSRGVWHREGDDGVVLIDADLGDVDEAATIWGIRNRKRSDARARIKARKDAADAEATAAARVLFAKLAARDAERAADEAAATARDRA